MIVVKELRGQHIGKKLMLDAEDWAKKKGFNCFYLKAAEAVGFYEKLGYTRLDENVYPEYFYGHKVYLLYKEC